MDIPRGTVESSAFGINDGGIIPGFYIDADNAVHGLLRAPNGQLSDVEHPRVAGRTLLRAKDKEGNVVGHSRRLGVTRAFRRPDGTFEDHWLRQAATMCAVAIHRSWRARRLLHSLPPPPRLRPGHRRQTVRSNRAARRRRDNGIWNERSTWGGRLLHRCLRCQPRPPRDAAKIAVSPKVVDFNSSTTWRLPAHIGGAQLPRASHTVRKRVARAGAHRPGPSSR
jgi:hypothetical protein